MRKTDLHITLILALWFALPAYAQENNSANAETTDQSDAFVTANRLLAKGQFASATKVWEQVVEEDPSNANSQFKLGMCYRNSLDNQDNAVKAFRNAVKSTTADYNFSDESLKEAPHDAMFFLGEAYLLNDEPDSALEQFIVYQSMFETEAPINVDRHILMCINAKRLKKSVRDVTLNEAGLINSNYAETHPVVTLDNNFMFYASRRLQEDNSNSEFGDKQKGQYKEDIYLSQKKGTQWQNADVFNLSTDEANEVPLSIGKDGLSLYYRSDAGGDQDVYLSIFEGGVWRKGVALGKGINTGFNESSLSVSEDGNHMYFTSDREGGRGGYDIYYSERKSNGKWTKPVNLGREINSPQNEECVFIHPTGNTLFWSSNGYLGKGMGGYDIYYSEKQDDGSWGEPQNLGYPINTTGDDLYYYIGGGGTRFYSRRSDERSFDVYEISGGGYEFENLEVGTEVVTLTEEMEVAEILEVEKEVQTEVEVLDLSILDEFETEEEDTVEEIDLSELDEEEPIDSADVAEEEEDPFDHLDVDSINMERLDTNDRNDLINLVTKWLSANEPEQEITDEYTVNFAFNSRGVQKDFHSGLNTLANSLKNDSKKKAIIEGHTDSKGDWMVNLRISNERAFEVWRYLRSQGVHSTQLVYYGKGSLEPVADNSNEDGQRRNRRVVVKIVE